MSYAEYLQRMSSISSEEQDIANTTELKTQTYLDKVRESIAKYGELSFGLFEGSKMLQGAQGLYGKWKGRADKLKKAVKEDGGNPEVENPTIEGEQSVGEAPAVETEGSRASRAVADTGTDTPIQAEDIGAMEGEEASAMPIDVMSGLADRISAHRLANPEAYVSQWDESLAVAPRGFGSSAPEQDVGLREWDQSQLPSGAEVEMKTMGKLDPAVARARGRLTEGEIEQRQMRGEAQPVSRVEETSFRPQAEIQPAREVLAAPATDPEEVPSWYGKTDLPTTEIGLEDAGMANIPTITPTITTMGTDEAVAGSGAVQDLASTYAGRFTSMFSRRAMNGQDSTLARAIGRGTGAADDVVQAVEAPNPSTSSVADLDVGGDAITPAVEGGETVSAISSTLSSVAPAVTSLGEEALTTGLSAIADFVPVAGQLAAVGLGIYDLVEAFREHKAPTLKAGLATGVSYLPEGAGSGYV